MSSLPEEKVPYVDSHGERYRNKQIIVQLPPYDSEAKFCNGLTDEEKRELRIFVALRKRDALDRGLVKQIPDVSEGYSCREVRMCKNCNFFSYLKIMHCCIRINLLFYIFGEKHIHRKLFCQHCEIRQILLKKITPLTICSLITIHFVLNLRECIVEGNMKYKKN